MSDAIKAAAEEHYPDGELTTVGVNAALREAFELQIDIAADLSDPSKTRVEVRGPGGWERA